MCRLLCWVTAVSRQMPPPCSGAANRGESVPDLNLECAQNHASLQEPTGPTAGCSGGLVATWQGLGPGLGSRSPS